MGTLLQDVRYGLRTLLRNRGFGAVAILTLSLGIGANTAIFSVVQGVLLRPLPFEDPERLVLVWESNPEIGWYLLPTSMPNFTDWKERSRSFDRLSAYASFSNTRFAVTGGDGPELIQYTLASADFFRVLGVEPHLGRAFTAEDDRPDAARVVVLGYDVWRRLFGGDPALVGTNVSLDGNSYTVVGIMPAGFRFPTYPRAADAWVPLSFDANPGRHRSRGTRFLGVVGRLAPGATVAQAQAEMATIGANLARQYPANNEGSSIRVVPLHAQVTGGARPALLLLLGAVGFVLLIACANVAGLLLARAAGRQREIAIRAALGAGRARLVRQLLTESVLLACLGGGAGLLLAWWGIDALTVLAAGAPDMFVPYSVDMKSIGLNGPVLLFTLLASLLAGLVFGVAPALHGSKHDLHTSLKEGSVSGTPARQRTRRALVAAEVGLSLVLLIGAALMMQSLVRLERVDPGFSAERALSAELSLPRSRYPKDADVAAFYRRLLDRLATQPGVEAAGLTSALPMSGSDNSTGFFIDGRPLPAEGTEPQTHERSLSPGYLGALRIALVRGRDFTAADSTGAPRVAIINETMARTFFPGEDPIGRRVALDYEALRFFPDRPPEQDLAAGWREIVGVSRDVRHMALDAAVAPEIYVPFPQAPVRDVSLVLRSTLDPRALASALRGEVLALDRDQPLSRVRTMTDLLADSVARPRSRSLFLSLFAGLAILLAAVGIYGLISYSVARRAREIGIRLALGAGAGDILILVLREAMAPACLGVGLGLLGALALSRLLSGLLYGLRATDPSTFVWTSLALAAVAALAAYIPARRAARIDPVTALRCE